MARLDRLAPVKEIAQIGAAIGREFSYRLLEAVSPVAGPALQDALRQLTASELIYGRGAPPEATYIFKHALVQDTAYSSLLRSRRQRIHADIARALWRSVSPTRSKPRRRSSRITTPRPGWQSRRRATGWRRRNWRCRARPTRRPAPMPTPAWR